MDDEWQTVVAPTQLRVMAADGANNIILEPNVPTLVPPSLFVAAIAAGCSIPGGTAGQQEPHEVVVQKLVEAMRKIITEGRSTQLTKTGEPRYSAVKMYVQDFTEEQRTEAWETFLQESTAPEVVEEER
jgi:hypothetical protein